MEKVLKIISDMVKNVIKFIFGGGNSKKYLQKAKNNAIQIQVGDINDGK